MVAIRRPWTVVFRDAHSSAPGQQSSPGKHLQAVAFCAWTRGICRWWEVAAARPSRRPQRRGRLPCIVGSFLSSAGLMIESLGRKWDKDARRTTQGVDSIEKP